MGPRHLDQEQLTAALNEWMRRYTDEPEQFGREWQTISKFLAQEASGETPTYGQESAAYVLQLHDELSANAALSPAAEAALDAGLASAARGEIKAWDELNEKP